MLSSGWRGLVLAESEALRLALREQSAVWPKTGSLLACCQKTGLKIREPPQVQPQFTLLSRVQHHSIAAQDSPPDNSPWLCSDSLRHDPFLGPSTSQQR
jgi:hypothetical protein